ncbi:hypothetical protein TREES_T100015948 [Tupaia chinensis]|uniref:Secreted protein n=1 Tax=Tupaia chinensis TaxID=246437 RepID=L9KX30_TUPCH|nr:hypothetical protein TREES_T100015948 [Tupaia chinensis]
MRSTAICPQLLGALVSVHAQCHEYQFVRKSTCAHSDVISREDPMPTGDLFTRGSTSELNATMCGPGSAYAKVICSNTPVYMYQASTGHLNEHPYCVPTRGYFPEEKRHQRAWHSFISASFCRIAL